jgi:hypothetical protein
MAGYYYVDYPYLNRVASDDPSPERWRCLATGRLAAVYFLYRQSPEPLVATSIAGELPLIGPSDPPPTQPGMATILLDASGRLLELTVVPRNEEAPPGSGATPANVNKSQSTTKAGQYNHGRRSSKKSRNATRKTNRADPIAPPLLQSTPSGRSAG